MVFTSIIILYHQNWFKINVSSGAVSVNSTLDRELAQQVWLKVIVKDSKAEQNTPQIATG